MSDSRFKTPGPGNTIINAIGGRGGMLGNIDNPGVPHLASVPTMKGKLKGNLDLRPRPDMTFFDGGHEMQMAAGRKPKPSNNQLWQIEAQKALRKTANPGLIEERAKRAGNSLMGSKVGHTNYSDQYRMPQKPKIMRRHHHEPLVKSSVTASPGVNTYSSNI